MNNNEVFTASNGLQVQYDNDEVMRYKREVYDWGIPAPFKQGSPVDAALKEFYLHQVGAWVDPETGALVIRTPEEDEEDYGRSVVSILKGKTTIHWEYMYSYLAKHREIKERYFATHPKPEMKPWQDAKPGDVWVITTENVADEVSVQVTSTGQFRYNSGKLFDPGELPIKTARRIWPEED